MTNAKRLLKGVDDEGNTVMTVFIPGWDEDALSIGLRALTWALTKDDPEPSGLGGAFGYGTRYENDTFMMHPYCWCEKESCPWCSDDAPNFIHKGSGFEVTWYKWIGRDNEINREITFQEWEDMLSECLKSIGCDRDLVTIVESYGQHVDEIDKRIQESLQSWIEWAMDEVRRNSERKE